MWDDYVWVVVIGSLLAFFTAYGIGANDVANAFATSVGAKAITITQAVMIASIFEFAGAVLLGSQVTNTVRKNIAKQEEFEEDPELLMYGMLCVLAATGIWLILASYLELPVSTTHSVIGGIIGMALVYGGGDAVVWYKYDKHKSALSKFTGVVPIIASWVISPILSGIFSLILFVGVRHLVLRHKEPEQRVYVFFPILVGLTVTVNVYFIILKGFSRKVKHNGDKKKIKDILGDWVHLVAWGAGVLSGVIVALAVVPRLKEKVENRRTSLIREDEEEEEIEPASDVNPPPAPTSAAKRITEFFNYDVHSVVESDKNVGMMHQKSEMFDAHTEEVFKYLQVFTATCDSFAHGANDVANSIGPFASLFMIFRKEKSSSKAHVPEWILVLGGAGIVVGLATYGYNIIRAIGVKLIKVTASRGFCIELGAAIVIVLGSQYGIPLSTTHCQVGATVSVGMLEGSHGVNGLLLLKVIAGWLATLLIVGVTSALFFAQGIYAPSVINLKTITRYELALKRATETAAEMVGRTQEVEEFYAPLVEIGSDISTQQVELFDDVINDISSSCQCS